MLSLVITWRAKTITIAHYRDPSDLKFLDGLEPEVPLFLESLKGLSWRLRLDH